MKIPLRRILTLRLAARKVSSTARRWASTNSLLEDSSPAISDFGANMSKLSSDQLVIPVPRDIEISQSIEGSLPHIAEIAEACGILKSELEPYGSSKAKVGQSARTSA